MRKNIEYDATLQPNRQLTGQCHCCLSSVPSLKLDKKTRAFSLCSSSTLMINDSFFEGRVAQGGIKGALQGCGQDFRQPRFNAELIDEYISAYIVYAS